MKNYNSSNAQIVSTTNTQFAAVSKIQNTADKFNAAIATIAAFFSMVMEEEVSPRLTKCILNTMISLTCLLIFGGHSILLTIILTVWFGVSVIQCKQAGM